MRLPMPAHADVIARRLAALILVLSFAFSVYKAATAAITYDEAYTYLRFAGQRTSHILKDYHLPNNHILHTLMVHYTTRILGDSLLAIRLPALCGAALFFTALWQISCVLPRPVGDLWLACTALTPALIDFNGLARGYSLGYGFCFAAVATLALRFLRDESQTLQLKSLGRPFAAGLLIGLAIACVPTFALFGIAFIASCFTIGLPPFRLAPLRRTTVWGAALLFGSIAGSWYCYARIRPDPSQWPVGYANLIPLLRDYLIKVHGEPETLTLPIGALIFTVTVLFALTGLYLARRRRESLPAVVLLTFLFICLGLASMNGMLRMNLPYPRALLFIAPTALFAVIYPIGAALSRYPRASIPVTGMILLAFMIPCANRLSLKSNYEWKSNAAIPDAIAAIDQHRGKGTHVLLSTPSEAYLNICVEYLIKHRHLTWLELTDSPNGQFLLECSAANAEAWPGRTIFSDKASGLVVRER